MSDYTPTTENVRQTFAYIQAGLDDDDGYPFVMHVHVETFDRWKVEVERAAAEAAWEKGYDEGCDDSRGPLPFYTITKNPYRREETE